MELSPIAAIACLIAVIYGILAINVTRRPVSQLAPELKSWLGSLLLAAFFSQISFLLSVDQVLMAELTTGGFQVLALSLLFVISTGLTIAYLKLPNALMSLIPMMAWWTILGVLTLTSESQLLGAEDWFGDALSEPVGILALGGWAASGVFMLLLTAYHVGTARNMSHSNRAVFWLVVLPLTLMGVVLAASGSEILVEVGLVLLLMGIGGMTYAIFRASILDTDGNIRLAVSATILVLLSGVIIAAPLLLILSTPIENDAASVVFAVTLAGITAVLHQILVTFANRILRTMRIGEEGDSLTQQLQHFSEAISGKVELEELVQVTLDQLKTMLGIQRAMLLFVNRVPTVEKIYFKPSKITLGKVNTLEGKLSPQSQIYKHLIEGRSVLRQADVDYKEQFQQEDPLEKAFFKQMNMEAFAPIIAQNDVVGVLTVGTKVSTEPYTNDELNLISTIANQVGIALRNARLVDDLRRREKEASDANIELSQTKEQLEQLDSVKTDFITIASHELRTPLAQVRGYTDIIEALNTQGMLDPEQLTNMTNNLRKATNRMEELIRNMLDVSQLDVNAMDLRFSKVRLENVIKLAIDPLTDAIRDRKQSLSARGLSELPTIEGDMKRLVQALQNVIVNAVKFTPDGGYIDISGTVSKSETTGIEEVVIAIEDSGIGIDEKNFEIIFEKFVRTQDPSLHSTGKTKFMGAGPGLGLTIARGVIDGHGGKIWATSDGFNADTFPGSTFYIKLPVKPPEDASMVLHFDSSLHHVNREQLLQALEDRDKATQSKPPTS